MFVNCDRPAGSLVAKLPNTKELYYVPIQVDLDTLSPSAAQGLLLQFDAAVRTAIAQCKGFFLDGENRFLSIVRTALLPEDAMPRDHAGVNNYFNTHYQRLARSGIQVCVSTTASPVWAGAKTKTDGMDRKGFGDTRSWLNTELYVHCPEIAVPTEKAQVEAGVGKVNVVTVPDKRTHMSKIVTSKLKESLLGLDLADVTFDMLYRMVIGKEYNNGNSTEV